MKSVAKGAFRGYGGNEIRIPEGVTGLADELFSECAFLERVYLPMSLEVINGSVFSGCRSLKEILVAEDHPFFRNYKGNLVERESGMLVCGGSNAVIEDDSGITAIGNGAYSGRSVLKYAYIGSSVKRIGGAAFAGCSNLTRVDFAEGLETIEGIAFIQSGIQWAKLPESIKSLAEGSFSECEDLRWIYLPEGVEKVGEDCLWAKDALYYGGTREEWLRLTASVFRPENVQFCAAPPRTGDGTPLLLFAAGASVLLALALPVLQKRRRTAL